MPSTSLRPPLAGYLGGKSRLAKQIVARILKHACYVEPFCGAAWVLFRKEPSKVEVLNDINSDIANLYRCIQHHKKELFRCLQWGLVSREEFNRLKSLAPDALTDIQRAARFYVLQHASFGGKRGSFGISSNQPPRFNLVKLEEHLLKAHQRIKRVYIENLPYAEVIQRYDRQSTFFYIDPPYWDCESDYGKGIFAKEDFTSLAALLKDIKAKFLLSLNDTPEIRAIFVDFRLEEVRTTYSVNQSKSTKASELLISNYDPGLLAK